MDFKTKLAFALVSASLLSMLALGFFTYLWAADMLFGEAQRQLGVVADSKQSQIRGVVDDWVEDLREVVDRLEAATDLEAVRSDPDRAAELLRDAAASSHRIRSVEFVEAGVESTGAASLREHSVAFVGIRMDSQPSFGVVLRAPVTLVEGRVEFVDVAFYARSLERFLGRTLKLGYTGQTSLFLSTPATSVGEAAEGYLVVESSGDGDELVRERRSLAEAPTAVSAALGSEEQIFTGVVDGRGREVMAAVRLVPELHGGIVVQLDSAEAREGSRVLFGNMRDIGVSLAAFAILGGTLLGLYLGRPIHKLVEEVDRIRHGELGLRLQVKGEDEVAFLARSLNEFMDQLDRSSDLFRLAELEVLVVGGDEQAQKLYGGLLQNWNMRPTLVETGAAALAATQQALQAGKPIQMVLLDDPLPDLHAVQLAEEMRASLPKGLPAVLLSADIEGLDAAALKQAGIGCVLPKPVVASHLMEAILDEMGVSAQGLASGADVYLKPALPRRILLAEDNPLIQRVMLGLLSKWGHEVTLAENGRDALDRSGLERFDLILMDVEMPVMNGLEATAAIRERERKGGARSTIVALTAEARSGDRDRCLSAGMDDYLSKPVDARSLYGLIERCPSARSPAQA